MERALALFLLVVVVSGSAVVVVVQLIVARWRNSRANPEGMQFVRRRRWDPWVQATIMAAAAVGAVCAVDAWWIEPWWPQVTRTRVVLPEHKAHQPLRIVHLTDLHSDPVARLEERIPSLVRDLSPDIIAFTGDALNSPDGLGHFRALMTELATIAPTFAVRGNWDVWFWDDLDLYAGTNVTLLDGNGVMLPEHQVWVGGSAVNDEAGLARALGEAPKDVATIYLHHYPERVAAARNYGIDLVLSGDTHGGQVRLPLIGPVIEMKRFGTYYDQGLHRVGSTHLYVSRGVGMEGGDAPRVRFLCRPEIALIELG